MANSLEQFILPDLSRNSEMIGWQIIDRPHISSRVKVEGRAARRPELTAEPTIAS